MKNPRSVTLGTFIASVILVAGYVNAAEPEAIDGNKLTNEEVPKTAEALADKKAAPALSESKSAQYDLFHTIAEGENLSVLAKRFTGDGNNWKAIAKANQLDENATVRPGQIIRIPSDLNKLAIESVPSPEWNDKQLAGDTKPDAEISGPTVTVPASFKSDPPKDLTEKSE